MRHRLAELSAIGLAALMTLGLAGCAADDGVFSGDAPPEEWGPWGLEFVRARSDTNSEFVQAVLADHEITEQEFAEARFRAEECWAEFDLGITWTYSEPSDFGGIARWGTAMKTSPDEFTSEQRRAEMSCLRQWVGDIWRLYEATRANPLNLPADQLTVECLVDRDLAPPDFTVAMWDELRAQDPRVFSHALQVELGLVDEDTGAWIGEGITTELIEQRRAEIGMPELPGSGRPLDDPEVEFCWTLAG